MQTLDSQPKRNRPAGQRTKRSAAVLASLVYEVIDGRPLYYQGHEQVLAGKKNQRSNHRVEFTAMGTVFIFYGVYDPSF